MDEFSPIAADGEGLGGVGDVSGLDEDLHEELAGLRKGEVEGGLGGLETVDDLHVAGHVSGQDVANDVAAELTVLGG